jgi:hypothetical protein
MHPGRVANTYTGVHWLHGVRQLGRDMGEKGFTVLGEGGKERGWDVVVRKWLRSPQDTLPLEWCVVDGAHKAATPACNVRQIHSS